MVSIIVPVYNTENYLESCIASLINQTFSDFEVLLIDDGSSDGSLAVCESFARRYENIRCFTIENLGVSYARNYGLAHAKGDLIAFCDSDDEYRPDYLERMVKAIEKNNADMAVCGYTRISKVQTLDFISEKSECIIDRTKIIYNMFLTNDIGGFVWNKLFRKEICDKTAFDESVQICEDSLFVIDCIMRLRRPVVYVPHSLYIHNLRAFSAVNNVDNLISSDNKSKYTLTFERMLKESGFTDTERQYIKADILILAVRTKCNYKLSKGRNKAFVKSLNRDVRHYFGDFIACKAVTPKDKLKNILNWLFNLKRFRQSA